MRLAIAVVCCVVSACGVSGAKAVYSDFTTGLGTKIQTNGYEVAESEISDIENSLAVYNGQWAKCATRYSVLFVDTKTINTLYHLRGGLVPKVAGFTDLVDGISYVEFLDTLRKSAFIHEAAHYLQYCEGKVTDFDHSLEPKLWAFVAAVENHSLPKCEVVMSDALKDIK